MFKLLAILALASGVAVGAPDLLTFPSIVSPQLVQTLNQNRAANIFISFKEDTSKILADIASIRFESRGARLNAVYSALKSHSRRTQEPISTFLSSQFQLLNFESFWITNQIYIRDADSTLVLQLTDKFPNLVSSIDEEEIIHLDDPAPVEQNATLDQNQNYPWGLVKIQAPEAWAELGGEARAGEGIIVATVDTGVRGTHEALRDNFVGEYGWFDPILGSSHPEDNDCHGTSVTTVLVGRRGIGVAPGAKWASCRGLNDGIGYSSDLIKCGQFMACPTLPDGSKPDCSRAPHVVSNSWGGTGGRTHYNGVIEVYHSIGIIPVFGIGNGGPDCGTAASPGDQNVIGVGGTLEEDEILEISAMGPSVDGKFMKPDITAPGGTMLSAYCDADDAYAYWRGTSMASPHVAGAVALLQTRDKNLNYQGIRDLLGVNADRNLTFSGKVCGGVEDNVFPNYVFGVGRLNAFRSVRAQTASL